MVEGELFKKNEVPTYDSYEDSHDDKIVIEAYEDYVSCKDLWNREEEWTCEITLLEDPILEKFEALVQGYDRKNVSPRCLVKVDIRKAFDSLNWNFLACSMQLMGFPQLFTDWVMACISSPGYSLKINGDVTGYFIGHNGLRQGDPLSPYLFVLGMEVLSKYLRKLCQQPHVSHHPKCHALNLTHLIFADDLMIFTRGDMPSVAATSTALHEFAQVSGLFANPDKTNVYFGGVPPSLQAQILYTTGFTKGSFPFSVLLPRHITKKISKLCKDFFWGIPCGERRHVFKSWKDISSPISAGGFNIKDLEIWNVSLLSRWVYLLAQTHSGLWAHWVQHYVLKNSDIWHIPSKPYFPYSFKAILAARDVLLSKAGSIFNVQTLMHSWTVAGKLSLHHVYLFLKNAPAAGPWTCPLTHSSISPSHKIICSLAVQNQLATIDNLHRRGICHVNRCVLCEHNLETCDHLFFYCPFSRLCLARFLALDGHFATW
ncbi:uncharacterized protein LOC141651661 [Silene latifolia]|uniref:uncharacterized protein LOC141651661 n=1 Tax=Silene latifolia TaxID=37657 RepID=UPI003D772559